MRFILASASPRRKELLERFITGFEVMPAAVDEQINEALPPGDEIKRLARLKALSVAARHPDAVVIGADTLVLARGRLLSKPADEAEALSMLLSLSAIRHEVLTAVCVAAPFKGFEETFCVSTAVTFTEITPEDARWYIATGEPFDKAGAYAVQGKGSLFVERVEGDYDSVVGLPCGRLMRLLKQKGFF